MMDVAKLDESAMFAAVLMTLPDILSEVLASMLACARQPSRTVCECCYLTEMQVNT